MEIISKMFNPDPEAITKLKYLVEQFKKGEVSELELELQLMAVCQPKFISGVSFKISNGANRNANTSYLVFPIAEKRVEGIHITYIIDRDMIVNNLLDTESLIRLIIIAVLKAEKIRRAYYEFFKSYEAIFSLGFVVAFELALYREILVDFCKDETKRKFLPDIESLDGYIEKLKAGEDVDATLEALLVSDYIPEEGLTLSKEIVSRAKNFIAIASQAKEDTPTEGLTSELKSYAHGVLYRKTQEIDPNYLPNT